MTTSDRVALPRNTDAGARRLRLWLLLLIAADLALLAAPLARYPAFFANPGALGYAIAPVAALLVYAALIGCLPFAAARVAGVPAMLRAGTVVGLVGGAIELVDIAIESLWALPQRVVSVTTGAGMLALFASFGVAGFVGSRHTRSFGLGIAAAICCAAVAILIAVTFGFLLANTSLSQLARDLSADPDFVRSGWTDVRAFAIANTADNGFTHLVEAPLIATVLGAAGSGLGRLTQGRRRDRT